MKKRIRVTSISFELPVLEYLHALALQNDRDRSYTVNQVIREHARRHGLDLPKAREALPPTGIEGVLSPPNAGEDPLCA